MCWREVWAALTGGQNVTVKQGHLGLLIGYSRSQPSCDPKWRGVVQLLRATKTPDVDSPDPTPPFFFFFAAPLFLCHICLSSLFESTYLCHLLPMLMSRLPEQCSHYSPSLCTNKAEREEQEHGDVWNKRPTELRRGALIVLSMQAI